MVGASVHTLQCTYFTIAWDENKISEMKIYHGPVALIKNDQIVSVEQNLAK